MGQHSSASFFHGMYAKNKLSCFGTLLVLERRLFRYLSIHNSSSIRDYSYIRYSSSIRLFVIQCLIVTIYLFVNIRIFTILCLIVTIHLFVNIHIFLIIRLFTILCPFVIIRNYLFIRPFFVREAKTKNKTRSSLLPSKSMLLIVSILAPFNIQALLLAPCFH